MVNRKLWKQMVCGGSRNYYVNPKQAIENDGRNMTNKVSEQHVKEKTGDWELIISSLLAGRTQAQPNAVQQIWCEAVQIRPV